MLLGTRCTALQINVAVRTLDEFLHVFKSTSIFEFYGNVYSLTFVTILRQQFFWRLTVRPYAVVGIMRCLSGV
jgi:hypothetical protein